MKRIKKTVIGLIIIGVLLVSSLVLISLNYSNFMILFNKNKPVIESDYSYITFNGEKYVPFFRGGSPYGGSQGNYFEALTKDNDLIGCLLFTDVVYKSDDYDNILWLISEDDEHSGYDAYILESEYNKTHLNIIDDSSYKTTLPDITENAALNVIDLIDNASATSALSQNVLTCYDIQKVADFNTVKKIYSDEYNDYYYTRFSAGGNIFYILFYRAAGTNNDLIPECAFFADKMYTSSDFDAIIIGSSTIDDVERIDTLTLHKNSACIYPTDCTYDKTTFHVTNEGVLFFCYDNENGNFTVKEKYIDNDYPEIVYAVKDNK